MHRQEFPSPVCGVKTQVREFGLRSAFGPGFGGTDAARDAREALVEEAHSGPTDQMWCEDQNGEDAALVAPRCPRTPLLVVTSTRMLQASFRRILERMLHVPHDGLLAYAALRLDIERVRVGASPGKRSPEKVLTTKTD